MNPYQSALPSTQVKYRALLDGDILLELLHNRSPFVEDVELLIARLKTHHLVEFYITDKSLRRIIIEFEDINDGLEVARYFQNRFEHRIIRVKDSIDDRAKELSYLRDFDSAVEHACAVVHGFDAIVTQNPSKYLGATIPIWSIPGLKTRLELESWLEHLQVLKGPEIFNQSTAQPTELEAPTSASEQVEDNPPLIEILPPVTENSTSSATVEILLPGTDNQLSHSQAAIKENVEVHLDITTKSAGEKSSLSIRLAGTAIAVGLALLVFDE